MKQKKVKKEERYELRNFVHGISILLCICRARSRTFLLLWPKNKIFLFVLCRRRENPLDSQWNCLCRRLSLGGILSRYMWYDRRIGLRWFPVCHWLSGRMDRSLISDCRTFQTLG